jgi:hypothetical protein
MAGPRWTVQKIGGFPPLVKYGSIALDSVTLVLYLLTISEIVSGGSPVRKTPQIRAFCCLGRMPLHPKIEKLDWRTSCPATASARVPDPCCVRVCPSPAVAPSEQTPKPALAAKRQAPLDREETRAPKPQPGASANVRFPSERGTDKRDENLEILPATRGVCRHDNLDRRTRSPNCVRSDAVCARLTPSSARNNELMRDVPSPRRQPPPSPHNPPVEG